MGLSLKGFTLTEVLIVVIILGILAAIVYPNFTKTMEIQRGREAVIAMRLIHGAELITQAQTGSYVACNDAGIPSCNSALNLNNSNANWYYAVFAPSACADGLPFCIAAFRGGDMSNYILMNFAGNIILSGCPWGYCNLL